MTLYKALPFGICKPCILTLRYITSLPVIPFMRGSPEVSSAFKGLYMTGPNSHRSSRTRYDWRMATGRLGYITYRMQIYMKSWLRCAYKLEGSSNSFPVMVREFRYYQLQIAPFQAPAAPQKKIYFPLHWLFNRDPYHDL